MRHQGYVGLRRLAGLVSLLLIVGVVGFAGGAGSAAFAASTQTVTIGTSLSPKDITVAPGTTVTWKAADAERHRIRSTSGPTKLDGDVEQGQSWSFTFTTPGKYAYSDDRNRNNAALNGTVTVGGAGSGGGTTPGTPTPPAPMKASVSLAGKAFSPGSVTVALGGTVTWTNNDSMDHNVTADAGAFKSPKIAPGGVFSFKFTKAGTYAYNCTYHGGMVGTVIVATASGTVPSPAPPAPPAPQPPAVHHAPPPPAAPAAPGKPGRHTVLVSDTGFTPATLNARAGDTVTWVNNGQDPHTATAAGGAFDLTLPPGASASTVLQKPGTIAYVCTYHSNMTGSIVVGTALPGVVVAPAPAQPAKAKTGTTAAGGGSSGPAPASTGTTKTYQVQVLDNSFSPSSVTARVGDTISWTNVGKMPHTVTAGNGSFDGTIAPGETYNVALRAEGTVSYVCTYHPGMDGMLIVGPALAGVAVPPAAANNSNSGAAVAAKPAAAAPVSKGKTKTIEIKVNEMTFGPAMVNANVGDTISWVNVGKIPHTVTAKDGSFDKTPMAPGERFSYVLRKEGSVSYVCTYHPGMDGMLIVGPALAGVAVPPAAANNSNSSAAVAAKPAAAAPVSKGKTKTIEIKVNEMTYAPAMANANVGDTISWVNVGKIPHTVTAKDGSFDKTPMAPGERFNYVVRKEGTFSYVCTYHPGMDGMLMVGPALAGVAVPAAAESETKPDSPAPTSAGSAQTHEIQVKDSSFTPATQEARVGDTISWVNLGKIPHTVTAKDHSFDKALKPGQRFNLVLRKQGTIQYVCTPHPGMFGVLIVGPALTDANPTQAPPMTLAAMSPVAMAGTGTGWLLIIGLLTAAQLRSRLAAGATRAARRRRVTTGDPS